jgi:hypothetical protein
MSFLLLPDSESRQVKMEDPAINGHASVSSSAEVTPGKVTHCQEEEELLDCTNKPHVTADDKTSVASAEATNSCLPADELFQEDMWDQDYYYDEQDSFS